MKLIAIFVQLLLWLRILISPVLGSAVIAFIICYFLNDLNYYVIYSCLFIGLVVGVLWAEKVRKGVGLSNFLGKVIAHRDIDGPGKPYE